MTDRELLDLAAQAAGIKVPTKDDYLYAYIDDRGIHRDISCGGDGTRMSHWNPLTDDGDALRLAVKLGIGLNHYTQWPTRIDMVWANSKSDAGDMHEKCGADPYAATRRAIVRAAAEIGKGMK